MIKGTTSPYPIAVNVMAAFHIAYGIEAMASVWTLSSS
jgi:hypothetical protein